MSAVPRPLLGGATAVLAAAVVCALAPTSTASAAAVSLVPATAAPNHPVTLSGVGFPRGAAATVSVAGLPVRRIRTGPTGAFAARLTVPGGRAGPVAVVTLAGRHRTVNVLGIGSPGAAPAGAQVATSRGARVDAAFTAAVAGVPVPVRARGLAGGRTVRLWFAGGRALSLRGDRSGLAAGRIAAPSRAGRTTLFVLADGITRRLGFRAVTWAPDPPGSSPGPAQPGLTQPGPASPNPAEPGPPPPGPPPPPPGPPRLVAVGDIACAPGYVTTTTACRHAEVAALAASLDPDAIAGLGDLQYETGTRAQFDAVFHPTWGEPFRSLLRPVPGNHEYQAVAPGGTPDYFGYFTDLGAPTGDPREGYYAYDLGDWRVIALNSNTRCGAVACDAASPQVQWFRAELTANASRCTLAYWHHPRFSSTVNIGSDSAMTALWDAAHDLGADVVLSGHAHNYERLAPVDKGGTPTTGGLRQFVVGSGGKSLHGFDPNPHVRSQYRNNTDFGVLELTLRSGAYDWRFVAEDGSVDGGPEAGTDACRPPVP